MRALVPVSVLCLLILLPLLFAGALHSPSPDDRGDRPVLQALGTRVLEPIVVAEGEVRYINDTNSPVLQVLDVDVRGKLVVQRGVVYIVQDADLQRSVVVRPGGELVLVDAGFQSNHRLAIDVAGTLRVRDARVRPHRLNVTGGALALEDAVLEANETVLAPKSLELSGEVGDLAVSAVRSLSCDRAKLRNVTAFGASEARFERCELDGCYLGAVGDLVANDTVIRGLDVDPARVRLHGTEVHLDGGSLGRLVNASSFKAYDCKFDHPLTFHANEVNLSYCDVPSLEATGGANVTIWGGWAETNFPEGTNAVTPGIEVVNGSVSLYRRIKVRVRTGGDDPEPVSKAHVTVLPLLRDDPVAEGETGKDGDVTFYLLSGTFVPGREEFVGYYRFRVSSDGNSAEKTHPVVKDGSVDLTLPGEKRPWWAGSPGLWNLVFVAILLVAFAMRRR